ncbi:uncharacterized protein V6R79_023775 [Siganus canaliculatus]
MKRTSSPSSASSHSATCTVQPTCTVLQPQLLSICQAFVTDAYGDVKGQSSPVLPARTGAILNLIKGKSQSSSQTRRILICMPRDTNPDIEVAGARLRLLA